jgi:hypothetical protein
VNSGGLQSLTRLDVVPQLEAEVSLPEPALVQSYLGDLR